MIVVYGLPKGHTTAMAAILRASGVNMGHVVNGQGCYGYRNLECEWLAKRFGNPWNPDKDWNKVANGVGQYLHWRGGVAKNGAKYPALARLVNARQNHTVWGWLSECVLVQVVRPWEQVVKSNLEDEVWKDRKDERLGHLTVLSEENEIFGERYPDRIVIRSEDLFAEPLAVVAEVFERAGLRWADIQEWELQEALKPREVGYGY